MHRRTLHIAMSVALLAGIASLVESSLSQNWPCPLCGGRAECIGALRSLSIDRTHWGRRHPVYRCRACDYEVLAPAVNPPDLSGPAEVRPLR